MRAQSVTTTGVQSKTLSTDVYGWPDVSLQTVVTGSATYTIEQTLGGGVWFPHPDTNLVAQTVNRQGNYGFLPTAIRLNQTAGAGSVTLTALQPGGSPA